MRSLSISASILGLAALGSSAAAAPVQIRVTAQNLAPANSVAFAPLRIGFGNGTFDAFNNGQQAFLFGQPSLADAPIVSVAEGGSGSTWFPAFAAAEPQALLGTVANGGPLLPGASASVDFTVDPAINRFFTFASMVVPSNDHFIGNDSPTEYELFNAQGGLNITTISQFGRDVWDAGSELTNPLNAAFLAIGTNALRDPDNGVVSFDFAQLDAFNGLTTAAGYVFDRQFAASDEIYRISFEIIPAPGALSLIGLGGLVAARRRR
jgi:hypothetical protein